MRGSIKLTFSRARSTKKGSSVLQCFKPKPTLNQVIMSFKEDRLVRALAVNSNHKLQDSIYKPQATRHPIVSRIEIVAVHEMITPVSMFPHHSHRTFMLDKDGLETILEHQRELLYRTCIVIPISTRKWPRSTQVIDKILNRTIQLQQPHTKGRLTPHTRHKPSTRMTPQILSLGTNLTLAPTLILRPLLPVSLPYRMLDSPIQILV